MTGTAVDTAGNAASVTVDGINVDLTDPTVSITGVVDGDVFEIGTIVTPGCSTADALSGVDTDAVLTVTGGNPDGSGVFTVTCAGATDVAGNVADLVTAVYEIHYGQNPGVFGNGSIDAAPAINTGNAGRNYPVHFELFDASGAQITDLAAITSITYVEIDCTTLSGVSNPVEAEANGNNGLTNTGGQYKFSWASPNSAGCYVLSIAVIDGSTIITANFDLR